MDPDQVEIIMNECCDEEDEDGCIPYESRFKIKILKRLSSTQCARTDLNKRFLPKPMTTTG